MPLGVTVLSLAPAWAVFATGMLCAWGIERRTGNAGWVDVVWTISLTCAGIAGFLACVVFGADVSAGYAITAVSLVGLWGWRLAGHLFTRSSQIEDDPRYRKMREDWGDNAAVMMALALQMQALLSMPMVFAVMMAATVPGAFTPALLLPGAAVAGLGLWIGWKSDRDLAAFKRTGTGLCTQGLWSWSRHPNYVGEIVFWAGIALLSLGHGATGLLAAIAPVTMYLLLRFFSGVPPLEKHMLSKYGAAYEAYCATTPPLFPWPWWRASSAQRAPADAASSVSSRPVPPQTDGASGP